MSQSITFKTGVSDSLPEELSINKHKGRIKGNFKTFRIKDGEFEVFYIPSLNFTGYGKTIEEAQNMIREILHDYFEKLIALKIEAITEELTKYGWTTGLFKKCFEHKSYIDKNGVLKNFELPEDTLIEESIVEFA